MRTAVPGVMATIQRLFPGRTDFVVKVLLFPMKESTITIRMIGQ